MKKKKHNINDSILFSFRRLYYFFLRDKYIFHILEKAKIVFVKSINQYIKKICANYTFLSFFFKPNTKYKLYSEKIYLRFDCLFCIRSRSRSARHSEQSEPLE